MTLIKVCVLLVKILVLCPNSGVPQENEYPKCAKMLRTTGLESHWVPLGPTRRSKIQKNYKPLNFKAEVRLKKFKNSVLTSNEKKRVTITNINWLIMFKKK
jgi:hypothetical protein